MHRLIPLFVTACLLLASSTVLAVNENTTIVLHARDGFAPCDDPQKNEICTETPPTLDITGMQMPWVYVMIRNYESIATFQAAFDWPLAWSYLGGTWDCLAGVIVVVQPSSPGPITGSVVMAFNCIQTGVLATAGRMIFGPPVGGGCLSIIESGYPDGTSVVDCVTLVATHVDSANRGRVCAGAGGYDACSPASTPVESVTWGAIKGQYR